MSHLGACLQLPLLAVLTVAVSGVRFAWEPYNLTATVREDADGCRAIEVSWIPGGCGRVDTSTVSLIRDDVVRDQTVRTESGVATFEGCDECSRYDIDLQTGTFCLRERLKTSIQTVCRNLSTIDRLGNEEGRNPARESGSDSVDGLQNGTTFISKYKTTATNEGSQAIKRSAAAPEELFLAGAANSVMTERPRVVNITAEYDEKNSSLSTKFTWKMSRPEYPVGMFSIEVHPCPFEYSQNIYVPEAEFRNLGFSSNITVEITAHYADRFKLTGIGGTAWLQTPSHIEPIKSIDIAKLSPTEVYLGWRPTVNASDYEVMICRSAECSTFRGKIPEVHLTNLEPGAIYDVEIRAHQENFAADYYTGSLKMLDQDYEAPRIASIEPKEKLWNRVTYVIVASVSSEVSAVEIEACSLAMNSRDCRRVRVANISNARLSLDYFERYEVKVTAMYKLPLNEEVQRSSTLNLNTIGADPDMLTSMIPSNITSNSLDLRWETSRNIPRSPLVTLKVFYEISTPLENWTTVETFLHLANLSPYTVYNFSVREKVEYLGHTYNGDVAQVIVQTEPSKPLKVQDLNARQQPNAASFTVSWNPPKVANGRLDYYIVESLPLKFLSSDTHLGRIRVVDTETNITLPLDRSDATYSIRVAAVNLNSKREELVGESAEQRVTVPGTGHASTFWKFGLLFALFSLAAGFAWWGQRRRSRRYVRIEENP